jgi:glycosyltransferase involved in cell wall biosynthesis
MSETLPSLTVVIPNYNHGHLIGKQLESIFSQSVQPTKIIIIDDASTDDSVPVIRQLIAKHKHCELVCSPKNAGVNLTVNRGIALATTKYMAFPAADDITLPGLYEKSLKLLARYPNAGLCTTVTFVHNESGTKISTMPSWPQYPRERSGFVTPEQVLDNAIRFEGWLGGIGAVIRRDALLEAGGYDPELHSYADVFACLVIALRHGACFLPEPLTIFKQSDSSYGSTAYRDKNQLEKMLVRLNAQMTSEFREFFPVKLVKRSNARMLGRLLKARLYCFQAEMCANIKQIRLIAGGKILLFAVQWAARILSVVLLCAIRYYDIPWIIKAKYWRRSPTEVAPEI